MLYMEELKKSESVIMDEWRNNLRSIAANGDVFEIIKRAIMVAASDHPTEFRIKRDEIAQILFSSELVNSSNQKNTKNDDPNVNNHAINYSGSEGDTTQDLVHDEVLRMKEILESQHESESIVYESLWRLEEMGLCFKTLEATKIGRSVNAFQNHASVDIRQITRRLIKKWRGVVDEWIEASEKTSCVLQEEEKKSEESSITIKAAEKQMVSMKKESSTSNVVKLWNIIKTNNNNTQEKAKMEERSIDISIEEKLEATKRKLHERYEEAQNAKRQRKIQVIQPYHQLKKRSLVVAKTKNQNRRWDK